VTRQVLVAHGAATPITQVGSVQIEGAAGAPADQEMAEIVKAATISRILNYHIIPTGLAGQLKNGSRREGLISMNI
jgi:hypothetical protein